MDDETDAPAAGPVQDPVGDVPQLDVPEDSEDADEKDVVGEMAVERFQTLDVLQGWPRSIRWIVRVLRPVSSANCSWDQPSANATS